MGKRNKGNGLVGLRREGDFDDALSFHSKPLTPTVLVFE